MALRNIRIEGDPILSKKTRLVEKFDSNLIELLDDMKETMIDAEGVGLAAPQVGILRRLAVIFDKEDGIIEIINPKILSFSGEQISEEGCLSCPGIYLKTLRPLQVEISVLNRNGEEFILKKTGFTAKILCHEIDHLDGILFKERTV